MIKLRCIDYGFECNFVAEGEVEHVIDVFREHTEEEHGIDYSKEAIMKYGFAKGFFMSVERILKCHPWGGHGHDPVR